MIKDKRVKLVKDLIESGSIKKYSDIYNLLPLTIIVNFLKTNHKRMVKYNLNPDLFTLREINKLAKFLEIPELKMVELFYNELAEKSKKRKPK